MQNSFLYSVNPKKIIKNLPGVPAIKVPKSLYLTKEDVKVCLKNAIVYRRFANEGRIERVTISNVDRLHNAKFMTEEEYATFLSGTVTVEEPVVVDEPVATVVEEPVVIDEPVATVEELVVVDEETVIVEEPVVVDEETVIVEESVAEEETEVVNNEETVVDNVDELETSDDEEAETVEEENNKYYNKKNYGGKNKNRH